MLEILFLSMIQGVTEFLPVSSSAHLILFSKYFSFENQSITLDMSLHIGSLLAVTIYFRQDLINFFKNKKFFLKIIAASIPVMLIGYLLIFLDLIEYLRNVKVIGWMTVIFGFVLYFADKADINKKIDKDLSLKSAMLIGVFQVLSLIPGVSRSGITISAARMLKFKREDAIKISFLLSIPTLAAVSFFNIFDLYQMNILKLSIENFYAVFLSFIFSFITIKYFLIYIKKFDLKLFVVYRIVLGVIILFFAYL
jgi:undecaprenyl-diphosphatase